MSRLHFLIDGRLGLMGSCGGSLVSRNVILTAAHVSWGAGLCATMKQIQEPAVVVLDLCSVLSTGTNLPAMITFPKLTPLCRSVCRWSVRATRTPSCA